MANDNRPEIVLDGDVSPFRQKLREAAADLKRFGEDGEKSLDRMSGPLDMLREKFVAVGALLAGGAVFKEAVNQAKEWNEQSQDMAAALGISATEASHLKAALAEENVEMREFMSASSKLANNLKNDEEALKAVGLATRDAAGNLRPLNELTVDAIELVGQYAAGTDRAIAASELFGKGFEISGDLAKINSELIDKNIERQRELGLVVTNESLAAFREYDESSKGVAQTMRGIMTTIGTVLMPALATLGNWFNAIGPTAVDVIRGALGGLVSAFHLVTTGVTVLWETINAMVVTVTEPIRAMTMAIAKAMTGDFYGAAEEIRGMGAVISGAWGKAFDEMTAKAQSTRERIANIFIPGTETTEARTGTKTAGHLVSDPADKKQGDGSMMAYYEAALAQEKRLAAEKDALREYTKAEELAYWRTLLDHASLSAKDRLAIERKVADLTVAVRRQVAKEQQDLDAEMIRHKEAMGLGEVAAAEAAARTALDLGAITQQQMIEQEIAYEARRQELQRVALEERLRMADEDPNISPAARQRLLNQIEEMDQQHRLRMGQLQGKFAKQQGAMWEDLADRTSSLWDKGLAAMMNGTFTWRSAFKAIGAEMVSWFATSVVGNMVKQWIAGHARQLAVKLGFLAQEQTAQATSSATVVATKASEATAVVAANAAGAGSGAANAMASIPWVGPVLALAAMASVFAAVSAMGGKVKSASRGYQVPKGVNPLMQIHEEEVVLPSNLSKGIAQLIENGGTEGAGQTFAPSIAITAMDSRDVVRALKDGGALQKALADMERRFVRKKS